MTEPTAEEADFLACTPCHVKRKKQRHQVFMQDGVYYVRCLNCERINLVLDNKEQILEAERAAKDHGFAAGLAAGETIRREQASTLERHVAELEDAREQEQVRLGAEGAQVEPNGNHLPECECRNCGYWKKHLDILKKLHLSQTKELERRVAELEADKERLDWLDDNANPCIHCPSDKGTFDLKWAHATNYRVPTLRAAIDAAREGE